MIVAAMLDAGLDADLLRSRIDSLGIENLKIEISTVTRCGITATSFKPVIAHQHHHRKLADITEIIDCSNLNDTAKARSVAIFTKIAKVEGRIHGKDPSDIGFHEVGAVDSIVDVVAACLGLEALAIENVCCSPMSVGGGTVRCAHGVIPVPAPATVELLKEANAPVSGGPVDVELLTPTAAAILTNFATQYGPLPPMTVEATGYGAGTRDFEELPNVLRLIVGETADNAAQTDCICLLECNLDDVAGETVGHVIDELFDAGALEVFTTPIQMKHNRPAVKLSVISSPKDIRKIEQVIFEQGLTLGIRRQMMQRSKLSREYVTVRTEYGEIRIKTGRYRDAVVSVKAEYADCAKAAKEHKVPLDKVRQAALKAFRIQ